MSVSLASSMQPGGRVHNCVIRSAQIMGEIGVDRVAKLVTSAVVGTGVGYVSGPVAGGFAAYATYLQFDNFDLSITNGNTRRSQIEAKDAEIHAKALVGKDQKDLQELRAEVVPLRENVVKVTQAEKANKSAGKQITDLTNALNLSQAECGALGLELVDVKEAFEEVKGKFEAATVTAMNLAEKLKSEQESSITLCRMLQNRASGPQPAEPQGEPQVEVGLGVPVLEPLPVNAAPVPVGIPVGHVYSVYESPTVAEGKDIDKLAREALNKLEGNENKVKRFFKNVFGIK